MRFPFKRKKKNITVLEIDNEWLKIVQARIFAKERKIDTVVVEKLVSQTDNKISERIRILSKDLDIDSNTLVISTPEEVVAIRNLELPSTNPAEIKDMVELQIGKQTPFTKEEIIYDFEILSTNEEGYSRVMLVIVHQDVIKRYFKILETAGLKTENIALSAEGLINWWRFAGRELMTDRPSALVNVGYDRSNFVVILKDKLIFCRNISIGFAWPQSLTEEWQTRFIEEINHSIYGYQNEMIDKEIDRIIITGADIFTSELNESILKDKLDLSIEVIPQLKNIPVTKECLERFNINAKNISVCPLFGLALTYPEQKINLIPSQLRLEKTLRERGRDLYLFGIYLVFILVTISSIFLGRMYNKERYLDRLKQEILKIQDRVDRLDNMMKEIEGIKRRILTRDFSLNFIYETHRTISPEIYLTSVSFDGEDSLILRGTSSSMSEIFKFLNALEESKYFQNVNTKFATTRKEAGKELTDFEIVCPLDEGIKRQLIEGR